MGIYTHRKSKNISSMVRIQTPAKTRFVIFRGVIALEACLELDLRMDEDNIGCDLRDGPKRRLNYSEVVHLLPLGFWMVVLINSNV